MVFKKGQIGRLKILKEINLWRRDEKGNLIRPEARILKPGEVFRVYRYDKRHGGQYDVGDNHWVTKIDEHIKYETPSKDLLAKAAEVYK